MNWSDRFEWDSKLVAVIIVITCFVVVVIIGVLCGVLCKIRGRATQKQEGDHCYKCQLIDMGEAACYTGICPDCGAIPPSRKLNFQQE